MTKPASSVPLKDILLLWTESSDQSALNRPLSTWSEAEDAIHAMAKVAPKRGYGKTGDMAHPVRPRVRTAARPPGLRVGRAADHLPAPVNAKAIP